MTFGPGEPCYILDRRQRQYNKLARNGKKKKYETYMDVYTAATLVVLLVFLFLFLFEPKSPTHLISRAKLQSRCRREEEPWAHAPASLRRRSHFSFRTCSSISLSVFYPFHHAADAQRKRLEMFATAECKPASLSLFSLPPKTSPSVHHLIGPPPSHGRASGSPKSMGSPAARRHRLQALHTYSLSKPMSRQREQLALPARRPGQPSMMYGRTTCV